jgi:hypothetical protein
MKKKVMVLVLISFFAAGWIFPQIVPAALEWKIIQSLDLKTTPLDIASSADGLWLFILTPGEILVFSAQEGKITEHVPVDPTFDRITSFPRGNVLAVTSSTQKTIQIIYLETVHKIDVTGLPFKGPQDAPVTIAVFTDYQ